MLLSYWSRIILTHIKNISAFLLKDFHLHFSEILVKNIAIISLVVKIHTRSLLWLDLFNVFRQEKSLFIRLLLDLHV